MKRENRYYVLKKSDIDAVLSSEEINQLSKIEQAINIARSVELNKPKFSCVVVESDWTEYEQTWLAIEKRVDSA